MTPDELVLRKRIINLERQLEAATIEAASANDGAALADGRLAMAESDHTQRLMRIRDLERQRVERNTTIQSMAKSLEDADRLRTEVKELQHKAAKYFEVASRWQVWSYEHRDKLSNFDLTHLVKFTDESLDEGYITS